MMITLSNAGKLSVNTDSRLTHWYIAISAFNLFWIVFSMICIEFTLSLNHIQNVFSLSGMGPGQLIPLLIGVASLLRVSYVIFRNKMGWTREEEETTPSAEGDSNMKYMKGLGPTMTNTNSTYSPPRKNPPSEPPPRRAIGPFRPHRYLLHRFLLAWLPWLGLFSFFRHPIDFVPVYLRAGRRVAKHDLDIGSEEMRPLRSQKPTVETESPEAAMLESTPQLYSDQEGLLSTPLHKCQSSLGES
jgi:hypothetical protein